MRSLLIVSNCPSGAKFRRDIRFSFDKNNPSLPVAAAAWSVRDVQILHDLTSNAQARLELSGSSNQVQEKLLPF